MSNLPFVSLIIATRNEEKYIKKCLDSIFLNDYPKEKIEVLLVDGFSEDKTKEIAEGYSNLKIVDNPEKFTPFAWNIGIRESRGEIVFIMSAHSTYSRNYISGLVGYLREYGADNVGGLRRAVSFKDNIISKAISASSRSYFGAGNSFSKIGTEKPKWVDTVFGGCYKKEIFEKVGLFNEKLIRSSDMEFNIRLRRQGGKILLAPDVVGYYYPKDNLKDFFLHNIEDGIWAILPLKFAKIPLRLRHYLPLIFILTLPVSIWPYIIVSLYFSLKVSVQEKNWKIFFVMPLVFGARHIGYGFGSLWGLIRLIT